MNWLQEAILKQSQEAQDEEALAGSVLAVLYRSGFALACIGGDLLLVGPRQWTAKDREEE